MNRGTIFHLRRLADISAPTFSATATTDDIVSSALDYSGLALIVIGAFLFSWLLYPCKKAAIARCMEPSYKNLRHAEALGLLFLLVAIIFFIASSILSSSYFWLVVSVLLIPLWFVWLFFFVYYRDEEYYASGSKSENRSEVTPLMSENIPPSNEE